MNVNYLEDIRASICHEHLFVMNIVASVCRSIVFLVFLRLECIGSDVGPYADCMGQQSMSQASSVSTTKVNKLSTH